MRRKPHDPLQVPALQCPHVNGGAVLASPGISPEAEHPGSPAVQGEVQLRNGVGSSRDTHRLVQDTCAVENRLALGQFPKRQPNHLRRRFRLELRGKSAPLLQLQPHPLHGEAARLEPAPKDPSHLLAGEVTLRILGSLSCHLVEPGIRHPLVKPLRLPLLHLPFNIQTTRGEMPDKLRIDPLQLEIHLGPVLDRNRETHPGKLPGQRLSVQKPQGSLVLEERLRLVGLPAPVAGMHHVQHEDMGVQLRVDVPRRGVVELGGHHAPVHDPAGRAVMTVMILHVREHRQNRLVVGLLHSRNPCDVSD